MLAKRVIPSMLVRGRTLVKGERFDSWRSIGHAAQAARIHAARGVDELLILDISATAEGRGPDLDLVRELSEGCFIPITVGGGVRSIEDIDALLRAGADKVAICSGAAEINGLIQSASARFGAQAIVACIDYRCISLEPIVHIRSGTVPIDVDAYVYAALLQEAGAGEILLSSIDRDGMLNGYDINTIHGMVGTKYVPAHLTVPLIVAGGCGTYDHMVEAFAAGADACASGAMFAFTDAVPREAAKYLAARGIPVRL